MQKTLNDLYSMFTKGDVKRCEFEGLIYHYYVHNQEKTCICHWKHDEYEDFISWFYPRMKIAVDSYEETGSSFEAFMARYLLISSKEYHVRTTTNNVIEYSAWSARIPEMYAREEPPVYIHRETKEVITKLVIDKKGRKNSRRILALILKCYYYISEDFAEKIAPMIDMESSQLLDMIYRMREKRQKKEDNIFNMNEKIYRQYYRCIIYDKRLTYIKENTATYNKMKIRRQKARLRLEKMRERREKMRTDASNSEIAEIIGITKGTVDASLSRLKTKWKEMAKKADQN
ncbi:MAG: hypothetical protein LBG94_03720 [Treponema sp.]|jgi:hypothetical protein|nr:hypothetical protein [Treponema sp.]